MCMALPSLTTVDDAGTALWTRLSQSFGYLNLAGYGGHRFPIAIGEFGTTFAETADQVLFADLARYLLNVQADGSPVDALHNPITSFFWFAWNANSGDTGGLVTSPNWDSIVWQKIEYLQGLGLAPWYTGAAPSTVVVGGTTPASPAITVNATPVATVAAAPVATNSSNSSLPVAAVPVATNSSNTSIPVATVTATNSTPNASAAPTNSTPTATTAATNATISTPAATNSTPVATAAANTTIPAATNSAPASTAAPASSPQAATNFTPTAAPTTTTPATTSAPPILTPASILTPLATNVTPTATQAITAAAAVPASTAAAVSTSPTGPTTPTTTATAPPPPTAMSCFVVASYSDYWLDPTYGPYMASVSLAIVNTGTAAVPTPWGIEVTSTEYTAVQYSWNWQIGSGYDGSTISGTASYDWQTLQPGGGPISVGYVAGSAQATAFVPASVIVNGQVCVWA